MASPSAALRGLAGRSVQPFSCRTLKCKGAARERHEPRRSRERGDARDVPPAAAWCVLVARPSRRARDSRKTASFSGIARGGLARGRGGPRPCCGRSARP